MEDNIKITYTKNMSKFNFNSTLNIPIDANANIKTILDINSYLFDLKVDCGNGKAVVSGKVGVKAVYLDTDNMTNTVTDSQSFNEIYSDSSITSDTFLNLYNATITNTLLSKDSNLKINCDVNIAPVAYLNLSFANQIQDNNMLITKKSSITTNTIQQCINSQFEYVSNLETKDVISKILCHNSYFTAEKTTPANGYAVVEGKLVCSVLYETTDGDDRKLKEMKDTSRVKFDVEIVGLDTNNILDLSYLLDKSLDDISFEMEDNNSVVTIKNTVKVCGVVLKNISLDIVDDVYSIENDIETASTKREFTKSTNDFTYSDVISNEVTLNQDEPAIDEVIANLGITPEITNSYLKDEMLFVEGVISSNLSYVDENKEIKRKQIEIPFIINTKHNASTLNSTHYNISVLDSRVKIKRGTIIEMEYSIFINCYVYEQETHEMIDSFKIGKQLDFSKYDFQIFLTKPGETVWDLCKRIKIAPSEIHKYNKDLPLVMEGKEKIIIKR